MKKKVSNIDSSKKLFVVNTFQNRGVLHINDGRCCQVKRLYQFADFETEQAALKCFDNNLKRCGNCFPKE